MLFLAGRCRPADSEQMLSEDGRAWLGEDLGAYVAALFAEDLWLPQEGLSLERLLTEELEENRHP